MLVRKDDGPEQVQKTLNTMFKYGEMKLQATHTLNDASGKDTYGFFTRMKVIYELLEWNKETNPLQ